MELISMKDFVLFQSAKDWSAVKRLSSIIGYAEFLNMDLDLGMFVTVNEIGNVIGEKYDSRVETPNKKFYELVNEYNKAKENVLFKGFEIEPTDNNKYQYLWLDKKYICSFPLISADRIRKVEDLIPYSVQITESGMKKIGLC